jgi:hypothetical protein
VFNLHPAGPRWAPLGLPAGGGRGERHDAAEEGREDG